MREHVCIPARGPIDARVVLPGSKSITNRALVAAALADGTSILSDILLAEDTRLMMDALRALGVAIAVDEAEQVAEVTGCRGHVPASEARLFCGNSGTTIRFCTAMVALGHGRYELDGVPRMRERPIGGLIQALQALGAGIEYLGKDGCPPIAVHARGLHGGQVAFHSPESSQWVSAVLLAAPCAGRDVLIEVTGDVSSVPYLKLTTAIMDRFDVPVVAQYRDAAARFVVPAPQRYQAARLAVEPDASNASYFLAAPAVVGGRVTIERLGTQSLQGDARFVDVLEAMGCGVVREPERLTVIGPDQGAGLHGIDVDLNDMPDTAQTLAVVALFAEGKTTIRNVASLRVKETDRVAALRIELTKLGARVTEMGDGLVIEPPERIHPAAIDTYNDHRMAMSFALAGLSCAGITLRDPDCVGKTFPDFFERFARLAGPNG